MLSSNEILATLDEHAKNFNFPILNHLDYDFATGRLSVFRKPNQWAIIIELLVNCPCACDGDIINMVHAYGDCLSKDCFADFKTPIQMKFDDNGNPLLDSIFIRNKHIIIDKNDLQPCHPSGEISFDVLVYLMPDTIQQLFANKDELHKIVADDMECIMVLNDWYHPHVYTELPSHTNTMRMIAKVLETGNILEYHPKEKANTNWQRWIDK